MTEILTSWKRNPEETLTLTERLHGRELIIASNRGPVSINYEADGEICYNRSSGGLVTALVGLADQVNICWIANAANEADKAWGSGDVNFADDGRKIKVQFVAPSDSAYDGFYNVISNPLLWFLQHTMWDFPRVPNIDHKTWKAWNEGYVAVNQMVGETIANIILESPSNPVVMLQDYHLYLAPRVIRAHLGKKKHHTITHFVHIPWPGPEDWGMLPPKMRLAILNGMCAADLIGFQTKDDSLNFLRTCESFLPGSNVRYGRSKVSYNRHTTYIRDFPISINVEATREIAASAEVDEHRRFFENRYEGMRLIVRVDRTEPSKNIVRGFSAFEEFLELHPEYIGKVIFLTLLVPSRMEVVEYQSYLDELMAAAGRVNAHFGTSEWEPVRILVGENYARAIAALQLYDVLLVNSIADGMNLVAKEGPTVNQKDGVLILSERTGARQQLEVGAIVISPCDVYATAEALHQALVMPAAERRGRAQRLAESIEQEDIDDWLNKQLVTLENLGL